jgi:hypothetical protein
MLNRLFKAAERNDKERRVTLFQVHKGEGEKIEDGETANEQCNRSSVDETDRARKPNGPIAEPSWTLSLVQPFLSSIVNLISLRIPPLATCALHATKLMLLLGLIRLSPFAPLVKSFVDLKSGTELPEDERIRSIRIWTLNHGISTSSQIHSLLQAYEWDVIFVFLKLVTTLAHNDAVRTLAMDFIFGRVWVEKYAGLEMAKVEDRLLKVIGEQKRLVRWWKKESSDEGNSRPIIAISTLLRIFVSNLRPLYNHSILNRSILDPKPMTFKSSIRQYYSLSIPIRTAYGLDHSILKCLPQYPVPSFHNRDPDASRYKQTSHPCRR